MTSVPDVSDTSNVTVDPESLTPSSLAAIIDHTFLKPFGAPADIEQLCREACQFGFAMVAIHPAEVEACAALLANSPVRVGAAIGFPLGQNTVAAKRFETRDAIDRGATEIDMVINIRALQGGRVDVVQAEVDAMAEICRAAGVISKVILETCYLSDEQKRAVCQIACSSGVDFVKTSTGFGTAGATVADVRLMTQCVGENAKVKASGGIRDLQTVLNMIRAGAQRIGTSSGPAIISELKATLNKSS